jgi:hypothetical protein
VECIDKINGSSSAYSIGVGRNSDLDAIRGSNGEDGRHGVEALEARKKEGVRDEVEGNGRSNVVSGCAHCLG